MFGLANGLHHVGHVGALGDVPHCGAPVSYLTIVATGTGPSAGWRERAPI
jgi:hypothetical protein